MSLTIKTEEDRPGRTIFHLEGRLDTGTTPELDAVMDPVLAGTTTTLVFELAKLEYISSAGLRAIFRAKKTMAAKGATVLVVHLTPPVKKVFDIVRAMPTESVFASWDELDAYLDQMQKKVNEED